jgi:hypothetical protein
MACIKILGIEISKQFENYFSFYKIFGNEMYPEIQIRKIEHANTDPWTNQMWDQLQKRSKHPL